MLPTGVALLSACLKREGHKIKLFDTTYYSEASYTNDSNATKQKSGYKTGSTDGNKIDRLMARPVKKGNYNITVKHSNVFEDFRKEVLDFDPQLIAMSCTEDMFHLGIKLINKVKDLKIPTLVGGVFPTFAPRLADHLAALTPPDPPPITKRS